jgi:hypothetical protein
VTDAMIERLAAAGYHYSHTYKKEFKKPGMSEVELQQAEDAVRKAMGKGKKNLGELTWLWEMRFMHRAANGAWEVADFYGRTLHETVTRVREAAGLKE